MATINRTELLDLYVSWATPERFGLPKSRHFEFYAKVRERMFSHLSKCNNADEIGAAAEMLFRRVAAEMTEKMNPPIYCEGTSYGRRY